MPQPDSSGRLKSSHLGGFCKDLTMTKRHCLECGGELVMAFRPSKTGEAGLGRANAAGPNANWRCSTCGHAFSAEQLRASKRVASRVVEQP
jgi:hypothetical protein